MPAPPLIPPSDYTLEEYQADVIAYNGAAAPGAGSNPTVAKQKRSDIAYGLMSQIDVVYGAYYNQLFSSKNAVAIGGDFLTLGLSTAASIATHAATKTIFSALGTGFSGLALSVDKNYFAQQTFPVIGIAMQTRRDKVRATIVANLALDTAAYPLRATKRDLVAYFNAGTLASGLQELQEEAGAATAANPANVGANKPPAPNTLNAVGGDAQVSLLWAASAGAASYNLYYSTSTGVTPANGTKISGVPTSPYTQSGLTNGTTYYYVVTAINASGESVPSTQASATPSVPAAPVGVPLAPSALHAVGGNAQVSLLWTPSGGATSYNLYYSTSTGVTRANGTQISGIVTNTYTQPGLTNGTTYYYVVTAVNATGESAASRQASATPSALTLSEQLLKLTAH
jgi:predicted phage tail protein